MILIGSILFWYFRGQIICRVVFKGKWVTTIIKQTPGATLLFYIFFERKQKKNQKTIKIYWIISSKVHCNQNKYIFTSFTARDRALYIFKELWKAKLQLAKDNGGQTQTEKGTAGNMVQNPNLERTESEVQEPEFDIDDSNNVERVSNASQNSDENGTVFTW